MTFISHMEITVRSGTRAAAIEAFVNRRVFEECAEAIPGFLGARLLEEQGVPDEIAVVSDWQDRASYAAWLAHPVRARQESDLAHFIAEPPRIKLYQRRG